MTCLCQSLRRTSRRRALGGAAAALSSAALTDVASALARAQESTPEGAATLESPSAETLSLVQYVHPEKVYFWVPGFSDQSVLAALYDLDGAEYARIKAEFDAAARGGAEELLADAAIAEQVDRLPFAANSVVVALGESDTGSLQSWFEILRHLLEIRRPGDNIRFVNAGISGLTTTQAFTPFVAILAQQPDWILCGLGANDALRIGPEPNKTLVSLEETARNLAELRRLAEITTRARWVWLTRPPIDEARMDAYPVFRMGPVAFTWRDADVGAVDAWLRDRPDPVVELYAAFGGPIPPKFQEPDGLHPTLAGHKVMAREVVAALAA